ncbi:MAG: hypothetical protein E4H14_10220 [Candidatus Thorarchaeota archaeon]|nr:MAG: hypothetical protein E4H14_10220 [Candidatus Thorarchaeota archaeon]
MKNRRTLLMATLIVFMLSPVVGIFSPIPAAEPLQTESAQTIEDPGTQDMQELLGGVNLELMMFVPTASDDGGLYYICRRGMDAVAYFGISEVHYLVGDVYFTLEFPGSNLVIPEGEMPTGSVTNYFYGSDSSLWRTGLADCAELRYREIYPGIDLVYRIQNGYIKYEFVLAPYADPTDILLKYADVDTIEVHDECVSVSKDGHEIEDAGLWAFQMSSGMDDVDCTFQYHDTHTVSFSVGAYDLSQELVIDPVINLVYSTFLGGSLDDVAYSIAVESGCAYVTGFTYSSGFPTVNAYDPTLNGTTDCFVTKFAIDGQSLVYSTFLGGASSDTGYSIAVESGYAYVAGSTQSSNFPTANAYDTTHNGGGYDCFVTKLAADGQSLIYSTFLGGIGIDNGEGIVVESGYAYFTGGTQSSDFPTNNAYDPTYNNGGDCFVTKFAADGQSLLYSTFLGGTSSDIAKSIAVESGAVYVTGYTQSSTFPTEHAYDATHNGGQDCFVTKFSTDGMFIDYSTFLGGTSNDYGQSIAVESRCAYITGYTQSSDFPTVNAYDPTYNNGYDCFVTKFADNGQILIYSTFLGGPSSDTGYSVAVESGCTYVAGSTQSSDFPTVNAYDPTYNGGYDCFVTKLTDDGQSLVYSTFLGGPSSDTGYSVAVESECAYVTGNADSSAFPTVNAYDPTHNSGHDCFMAIISLDADMDGLLDWDEARIGTNLYCIDSDNDNFLDGYEVAFGSNPLDPFSYPSMPQAWYDAIYEDLDGNATLIQNLIAWSNGNSSHLETVIHQLAENATLVQQVIAWLDGNHTAIETLFTYVNGNASLLLDTVNYLDGNATQLYAVVALVTHNANLISLLNASVIGDFNDIRAVIEMLGASVGDLDYDGLDDLDEIALGTDVDCIDTDCDNLNDAFEVKIGTDPLNDDSDGDSYLDGLEVIAGTNPLDALDYPGSTRGSDPTLLIVVVAGAGIAVIIILITIRRMRGRS